MPDDKCKGVLAGLDFLLLLLPAGEAVKRQRESESERVRFLLLLFSVSALGVLMVFMVLMQHLLDLELARLPWCR